MDRLSAIDASFLAQEGPASHMHVGAVLVFEGPPPAYADLCNQIRSRLHLVPRYRQKLAFPPLESGRPLWVDDPSFNLEFHIRHTALPAPGSDMQLRALAARINSQQLDRGRPLWELWLVQGLEGNRFALISKTHHAMIDGISGVDLITVIFDLEPVPQPTINAGEPWTPRPCPTTAELAARSLRDVARAPLRLAGRAAAAATHPSQTVDATREALEGVGEIVWAGLNPAPPTPLNVRIGPHRRFAWVRQELSDYKLVKDAFGGTVNDVVLTVVSGALRRFLRSRSVRTEGLELRALVPVSVRTSAERNELGNRLAAMRGPLPVYIEDPVARLRVVREAMSGLKESKQAVGAEVLAAAQNFAPPTVLAQASRLNFSTRLFNLIVTNVPGPQFPVYLLGRELQDLFPVAFLPTDHALAVAIMSYNGGIDFGLLGDFDALHDLDALAGYVADSLDELVASAAPARSRPRAPAAAPSSPPDRAPATRNGRSRRAPASSGSSRR